MGYFELNVPVTFAAGEPEPHCAETEDASASTAVKIENLAIVWKKKTKKTTEAR